MKIIWLSIFLFCLIHTAFAQVDSTEDAETVIESILDNSADEQDLSLEADELEYYHDNPINLRTAVYSELIKLPFISSSLAIQIILLRDTVEISSLEVLRAIPEMTEQLMKEFSLFTTTQKFSVDVKNLFMPTAAEVRSRYKQRIQIPKGFQDGAYAGNRDASYQRIKIGNSVFQLAGLFEKDAGERFNDGYFSGYGLLQNYDIVKKLVIGNYVMTFGEGLALAKNMQTAKGTSAVGQIKKRSSNIYPTVSADEFRYFQGAATTITFNPFELSVFYSQRNLAASQDTITNRITSFYTAGLYRTAGELRKRDVLKENTFGSIVTYSIIEGSQVGIALNHVRYNTPLAPTIYNFENEQEKSIGSFWTSVNFSSVSFFSEYATNDGNRYSSISGVTFQPVNSFAVAFSRRSYSQGFTSPFARPFGVRDNISDGETGTYFGIELKPIRGLYLSAYIDSYELPEKLTFGSSGRELFFHSLLTLDRLWSLYFHVRNKQKDQPKLTSADDVRNQNNIRLQLSYKISRAFLLTQRLETITVDYKPTLYREKGFLLFTEVAYKTPSTPFFGKIRFIIYDTDSYDSRIYQYESDVQGNFSNPPLYGKGSRWYFVGGYKIIDAVQLSLKYSETIRFNTTAIGSGSDLITGNLDNQIALQIDIRL